MSERPDYRLPRPALFFFGFLAGLAFCAIVHLLAARLLE